MVNWTICNLSGSVCGLLSVPFFVWFYNFLSSGSRLIGKARNLQLVNLRNLYWMRLHLHWLGAMGWILRSRIHLLSGFCVSRLLQFFIPSSFWFLPCTLLSSQISFLSFQLPNLWLFSQEASLLDITNQACSLFSPLEVLLWSRCNEICYPILTLSSLLVCKYLNREKTYKDARKLLNLTLWYM